MVVDTTSLNITSTARCLSIYLAWHKATSLSHTNGIDKTTQLMICTFLTTPRRCLVLFEYRTQVPFVLQGLASVSFISLISRKWYEFRAKMVAAVCLIMKSIIHAKWGTVQGADGKEKNEGADVRGQQSAGIYSRISVNVLNWRVVE